MNEKTTKMWIYIDGVCVSPEEIDIPTDSFWSIPSKATWKDKSETLRAVESEVRTTDFSCLFGSSCSDHPVMVDPETEKRRAALSVHDFNAPVSLSGVSAPKVIVSPGVHYRDVKYQPVPSNEWDEDFDPRSLIKPPPPKPIAWIKENIGTVFLVLAAFAAIICVLTKL